MAVGRGPVPRHASVTRTIAGDRPPRYDAKKFLYRMSWITERSRGTGPRPTLLNSITVGRACLSPCLGLPNDRGGQAPALRS